MGEQFINISWIQYSLLSLSPATIQGVSQIYYYTLTIGYGLSSKVIFLNDSYYYFTAPEGASPCEVYNFSVAATYVGATCTGPVLSTMIPSLIDIKHLSDTISYHLVKLSPRLTLSVYFEVSYNSNIML